MDVENLAKELILKNMTPEQQMAVLDSVRQSVLQAKEVQKKKIGENVDLVVQALKKIEADIRDRFDAVGNNIEKRVLSIKDGRDGANGTDGRDGKDGKAGRDGLKGDKGADGQAGRDGVDGVDGVSVTNAHIDFDGSLVISLSDGRELNVGEVVSQDIAEKIKVISTMSTNGAVGIKDEGSSISTGVKTINFVGAAVTATNSGDDVTVNVSSGTGTVTSVAATAGTGISVSGSPITTTGTLTITNTAPDQTVVLTAGTGISAIGTYPNFTITNSGVTSAVAGTGISVSGATGAVTISNTGVTSVTGTSPVVSSGGATPAVSLASGYGDTLNPYASKTANYVLAAPNGSAGVPTFRAVVAADIPTLNQNTTGNAATVTTNANLTGVVTSVGNATSLGSFTSAQLATALTDETGTGANVFATSPTLVTPILGTPTSATLTNATGLPLTTGVTGTLPEANGGTGTTTGYYGFKNRIINGAMVIDQRNAGASQTFTAAGALAYAVDRFYGFCTGANVTGAQVAGSGANQFRYRFTGAASVTAVGFGQRIEQKNSYNLAGSTATLSADLAISATLTTVTWTASYATTTADTFGTLASPTVTQIATGTFTVTSTVTNFSTNITIPAAATTGIQIVFTVGALTAGLTWTVGNVQLEKGSTATSFDYRPYGTELALCQRYFCKTFPIGTAPNNDITTSGALRGTAVTINASSQIEPAGTWKFPVSMRTTPSTITLYAPGTSGHTAGQWTNDGNAGSSANARTNFAGTESTSFDNAGVLVSAGFRPIIHASADAEL